MKILSKVIKHQEKEDVCLSFVFIEPDMDY